MDTYSDDLFIDLIVFDPDKQPLFDFALFFKVLNSAARTSTLARGSSVLLRRNLALDGDPQNTREIEYKVTNCLMESLTSTSTAILRHCLGRGLEADDFDRRT